MNKSYELLKQSHLHPIVLFDGICTFCNQSVQLLINLDANRVLRFGSLQSDLAQELLQHFAVSHPIDSIVFIEKEKMYTESTAVLRICRYLRFPWKCARFFLIFPRFLRDPLYRWFASHRYQWFGKQEQCSIPSPEVRERFIDFS